MLLNTLIAALLMVVTCGVHASGMHLVMNGVRRYQQNQTKNPLRPTNMYRIGGTVLLMFLVSLVEVMIWASTYLALNAIEGFERALYFSMVTFTTLGYGEIVLDEHWRLLASFQAANGIIMFGWTTAIVIAVVQHVYFAGYEKPRPD
jgi:hypothetical protein